MYIILIYMSLVRSLYAFHKLLQQNIWGLLLILEISQSYLFRDIWVFIMYYIYGVLVSVPSLLVESTDSMIGLGYLANEYVDKLHAYTYSMWPCTQASRSLLPIIFQPVRNLFWVHTSLVSHYASWVTVYRLSLHFLWNVSTCKNYYYYWTPSQNLLEREAIIKQRIISL